jgi:hypothetical protein
VAGWRDPEPQGTAARTPETRPPGGEADIIGARGEQGGVAKDIFVHEGKPQAGRQDPG